MNFNNKRLVTTNEAIASNNKSFLKYLKTTHFYHLVDPSPWFLVASLGAFMLIGGFSYMHKFVGGWQLLAAGFALIICMVWTWWRDVIREATFENKHMDPSFQKIK